MRQNHFGRSILTMTSNTIYYCVVIRTDRKIEKHFCFDSKVCMLHRQVDVWLWNKSRYLERENHCPGSNCFEGFEKANDSLVTRPNRIYENKFGKQIDSDVDFLLEFRKGHAAANHVCFFSL